VFRGFKLIYQLYDINIGVTMLLLLLLMMMMTSFIRGQENY